MTTTTSTKPELSYLTVYNPTLIPQENIEDEDAEEQAHILFYTSRERAVSRDRMLRQVGLAKALVNFSAMLDDGRPCDSIHSQSRRMFMISPEPNFWIHAAIEVAKSIKTLTNVKDKSKKAENKSEFYYQESSVNDQAIRAQLLRGYELFKLKHGSFTTILGTLGQQALELQLERFFTPWAWSWDLESRPEFEQHNGIPLHPLYSQLSEHLDEFEPPIPSTVCILFPPHLIPSTRFIDTQTTDTLPRFLLSHSSSTPSTPASNSGDTLKAAPGSPDPAGAGSPSSSSTFLGLPPMNVSLSMNVGKWAWPDYLTFGKNTPKKKPSTPRLVIPEGAAPPRQEEKVKAAEGEVDQDALEDAMSSEQPSPLEKPEEGIAHERGSETEQRTTPSPSPPPPPMPAAFSMPLHFPDEPDSLRTTKRRVFLLELDGLTLVMIPDATFDQVPMDLGDDILQEAGAILHDVKAILETADKASSPTSLQTASKILQPRDRYISTTGPFINSQADSLPSRSEHLYNAQALRLRHSEIQEVFSRGQNPQHWHVAKAGLSDGDAVYLEVGRKETSLADVDNTLAGLLKRKND